MAHCPTTISFFASETWSMAVVLPSFTEFYRILLPTNNVRGTRIGDNSLCMDKLRSFTGRVLVYRMSSRLQEEFSFTGRVLVYRKSSRVQDEFSCTGRVFVFRKSSRVQDEFSFTGRVFVHRKSSRLQ